VTTVIMGLAGMGFWRDVLRDGGDGSSGSDGCGAFKRDHGAIFFSKFALYFFFLPTCPYAGAT
jgi:hypothetical protein